MWWFHKLVCDKTLLLLSFASIKHLHFESSSIWTGRNWKAQTNVCLCKVSVCKIMWVSVAPTWMLVNLMRVSVSTSASGNTMWMVLNVEGHWTVIYIPLLQSSLQLEEFFLLFHVPAKTSGMIVKGTECFVAVVMLLHCVQRHTAMMWNLLALITTATAVQDLSYTPWTISFYNVYLPSLCVYIPTHYILFSLVFQTQKFHKSFHLSSSLTRQLRT